MVSKSFVAALGLFSAVATAAPAPSQLSPDDIIVLKTDGTSQVMKLADLEALEEAATPLPSKLNATAALERRGCDESTEVQVLTDEQFLDWDIAISPVLSSAGGSGSVSVSSGYSISNSVSATAGMSLSALEGVLGLSLSVQYSESWSTTESQSLTFTVPDGKHGVIVSQPYVRRVTGVVYDGCTDSPTKTEFTSDSYESQSYGNLEWVKGIIRLCSSDEYPIPFCNGQGKHT